MLPREELGSAKDSSLSRITWLVDNETTTTSVWGDAQCPVIKILLLSQGQRCVISDGRSTALETPLNHEQLEENAWPDSSLVPQAHVHSSTKWRKTPPRSGAEGRGHLNVTGQGLGEKNHLTMSLPLTILL